MAKGIPHPVTISSEELRARITGLGINASQLAKLTGDGEGTARKWQTGASRFPPRIVAWIEEQEQRLDDLVSMIVAIGEKSLVSYRDEAAYRKAWGRDALPIINMHRVALARARRLIPGAYITLDEPEEDR